MAEQGNRLFVILPDGLKREAKVKAAREDTTVSAVTRAFLEAWVRGEVSAPQAKVEPARAQ
jgi:plasmid stability protein